MRFELGRIVATRNCLHHLVSIKASAVPYLKRHASGDWGNLGHNDKQTNELAITNGNRILSKYLLPDKTPIYVITEADRSVTTIMLTGDY
jgi:hypothetical protein